MLLEPAEFLAVKPTLVADVIAKLKHLARVEANLLFREYKQNPALALPPTSQRISRCITRLHDAIVAQYDTVVIEKESWCMCT